MKKIIFLFSFAALAIFSCQKANLHEEAQAPVSSAVNSDAADRNIDCTVQITPVSSSGNCWYARVYVNNVLTAKICGPCPNPPAGYTVLNLGQTLPLGGSAYKKFRIEQENLNVTYKIESAAGCFNISALSNTGNYFYAGCATPGCSMSIKVNSVSSLTWLAEVRRRNAACTDEAVTTIGSSGSGAAVIIPTGQTRFLEVDGFKQVYIKQITGSVNYTLDAPSVAWASISPATFTVNPGTTISRRLGCDL